MSDSTFHLTFPEDGRLSSRVVPPLPPPPLLPPLTGPLELVVIRFVPPGMANMVSGYLMMSASPNT